MSISFACDFCSRKYRVDDGLAGRKVKCKECGTDLTIPGAGAVTAAAKPARDLYGLYDEIDAPPPPRRPGFEAEARPSRSRARASSPAGDGGTAARIGNTLLVLGGLSFVLPFIGLQVKGLHLMPPEMQIGGGLLLLVAGAFLRIFASTGFLKVIGYTIAGGLLAVIGLIALAVIFAPRGRGNANPGGNQFAGPGVFVQAPANLGRVAITGGRAMTARGPGGFGTMGVALEVDYRVETRPPGVFMYDVIVKSSRGRAKIVPPVHLNDTGTLSISVPSLNQEQGPFEVCFEAEMFGPGGRTRKQVSDSVAMNWVEAPPARDPFPQPHGFTHPPNNMPQPPNFPAPPQFPRHQMPRFGPRGR